VNTVKTGLLLAALAVLAVVIGRLFGPTGMIVGLGFAILSNGVAYFFGDKIALSSVGARPLQPGELPWLDGAVDLLCRRAGIPVVPIYISEDPQPNAFAAGRGPGKAVICVNRGLLETMNQGEVEAVIAHEIGHVVNRDTLIMTVAAATAGMITYVAQMAFFFGGSSNDDREGGNPLAAILMLILAPFAAMLIQLAISRTREFGADRKSAELMDSAAPMINALRKLELGGEVRSRFARQNTAHMYISAPFSAKGLFSTHPEISERVRRLAEFGK
jgi:heat shock protein HtpX